MINWRNVKMTISYKVMKTDEFEDAIFYRTACSCGGHDHDITVELEWDKKVKMVFMNFYKKLAWCAYWGVGNNWFKSQWKKLQAIYKIIFHGYIEIEESLIFQDPEHIENFMKALEEGRKKLEEKYKENQNDKGTKSKNN